MKRFAILSLVVSLLASMFVFSSCTDPEDQPEATGTETETQESVSENVTELDTEPDTEPTAELPPSFEPVVRDKYTVTSENGKAVVRLSAEASTQLEAAACETEGFGFRSKDEYRETLLNGTLDDMQLKSIQIWEKRHGKPVCLPDPNSMAELQLPDGWEWSGSFTISDGEYTYYPITSPEGSGSISFFYNEDITYDTLVTQVQDRYHPKGYEEKAYTYLDTEAISIQHDTSVATLLEVTADVSDVLGTGDKQYVGFYYVLDSSSSMLTANDEYPYSVSFAGMTEKGTLYKVGWRPTSPLTKQVHEVLRPAE